MSSYGGLGGGRSPRLRPRLSIVGSEPENPYDRPMRPQRSFRPVSQGPLGAGSRPASLTAPLGSRQSMSLEQATLEEVVKHGYQRPRSVLGQILRVLSLPENVIVGFTQGVVDGFDDGALPPWAYVKALGLGFSEIPSGISENANWTDFIRERADPDSFWYKHSSVVGLGMSVFFDPTMYLTFGATGAAKLTARGLWYQQVMASADEVVKAMASGRKFPKGHPLAGRTFSPKDDFDTAVGEVHLAYGRPVTLGDQLKELRAVDRSGASGRYRQVFARGGRGTRFAGMEIPGTRIAGEQMANFFRGRSDDILSLRGGTDWAARAFIPDVAMHSVGSELVRTVALLENNAIRRETAAQGERISKQAEKIALLDNPIARQVSGILGSPQKYVPQAARSGALRSTKKHADPNVADLVLKAQGQRGNVIQQAKNVGMDEKQIRDLNELWERLVRDIDEPIEVTAQFVSRGLGRILAYQQIRKVLDNPILARRIEEAPFLDPAASTAYGRQVGRQGLTVKSHEAFGEVTMLGQVVKQGTKPFRWQGKDYAVANVVGEVLENLKNPAFIDVEMSRFFRMVNGPQNLWKIPATILNPSFHITNMIGGMWNNMLAGPYGPVDHLEAWARVAQKRIDDEVSKGWASKPILAAAKSTVLRRRREGLKRDIITPFEARGGGGGMVRMELSAGAAKELGRSFGSRPFLPKVTKRPGQILPRVTETGKAFTAARYTTAGLGAAEIATNIAAYNGWIEDFNIPGGNEFWGVVGFAPELARGGRFTASYTENILRLTPFQEAWKDKSARQILEAVGPITPPNFAKMAPKGLSKKQEAAMFNIGTDITTRYQFDYTHLTDTERKFAKTIFPFWTFYKNNFVLQSKEVLNRPRFVQGFYHMATYIEEEWGDDLSPEMEQLLPEYFENLGAFQVPVPNWARDKLGLPQETPLFLNPKLPFVSLNLFPPFWELWNNKSVTPFYQRALQVFSGTTGSVGPMSAVPVPGAKLMFEAVTGTNLGLARPIDYQRASSSDWRQSFTPAPGYVKYLPGPLADLMGIITDPVTERMIMPATSKYIMDNLSTPFITNYGKVVPSGGSGVREDKARADLVAWMTGIRLMPVDPLKISRSWSYRLENMLEARKAERGEQGLELEPEDEHTLQRIRTLIKGVERQWDAREAELYG